MIPAPTERGDAARTAQSPWRLPNPGEGPTLVRTWCDERLKVDGRRGLLPGGLRFCGSAS